MNHSFPKISIITTSFNQGQFLEETILSVITQNYPNLEYIIIDGGSTDNSVEIIKKYDKHIAYWVSEKDNGQSHAIAKGVQKSTGKWINWINSDDALLPDALKRVAEAATSNQDCNIIVGRGIIGDEHGNFLKASIPTQPCSWSAKKCIVSPFFQQATFWTRDAYESVGGLNEDLFFRMDTDLLERMLIAGAKPMTISSYLGFFRVYEQTKSTQNQKIRQSEFRQKLVQNGVGPVSRICAVNKHRLYRLVSGNLLRNKLSQFYVTKNSLTSVWQEQ